MLMYNVYTALFRAFAPSRLAIIGLIEFLEVPSCMPRYIFIPDCDQFDVDREARVNDGASASANVRWISVDRRTAQSVRGELALTDIPASEATIAVVPIARIAFIDAILPPVSAHKREQLLNFAIEDKLTIDPATVHAVILGASHSGANHHVVAAIDRAWLARALAWMAEHGVLVRVAVPETALHAVAQGEWLVHLNERAGYAVRADGLAYGIDLEHAGLGEPPFALILALNEAAAAADSRAMPTQINIEAPAAMVGQIDRARWQALLSEKSASGIELAIQGASPADDKLLVEGKFNASNLLVGHFKPATPNSTWHMAFRPAMWLVGALLGLHVGLVGVDAWRLAQQRGALDAEMRALFRQHFPEAATIVDAPLQLSRNLTQLKRERGIAADVFIAQLATEAQITRPVAAEIRALKYDDGKLVITLTPAAAAALQSASGNAGGEVGVTADATTLTILRGKS